MMFDAATNSPALLSQPPRAVRWKSGKAGPIWLLRIFTLPILLLALFMPALIALRLYTHAYGAPMVATIDSKEITYHTDRHGSHTNFKIRYHYDLNGQTYADSQNVSSSDYYPAYVGQNVGGNAVVILGLHYSLLNYSKVTADNWVFGFISLIGFASAGIFLQLSWIGPSRERGLLRDGSVAKGKVVDAKILVKRRPAKYSIKYEFSSSDGAQAMRTQLVNPSDYDSLAVGAPVTVFYNPLNPNRNVAYECCNYEVIT